MILIESQWNLNLDNVNDTEIYIYNINRITVEFKYALFMISFNSDFYINRITVEFKSSGTEKCRNERIVY